MASITAAAGAGTTVAAGATLLLENGGQLSGGFGGGAMINGTLSGPTATGSSSIAGPTTISGGGTLMSAAAGTVLNLSGGVLTLSSGSTVQVDLATADDLTVTDRYIFDGEGAYLGSRGFSDGSLGNQVIGALGPLHFGWWGAGVWAHETLGVH